MDPATIVGTAAAVADIVGIISKTIKVLRDLHNRWKDADLTIINLMAQLTCLRAALNKISEWVSSDLADVPQHHQLVLDLEDSVTCCRMLVKSMDGQISELDRTADNTLDVGSRIKVVFEDKAGRDFQKFIKRQTSALALLLTACNCKTSSEQKRFLEKPSARQVFDQIKDDSSSLIVLHDTASDFTACTNSTGSSSKWSRMFLFDTELLTSPVYQRAVRALFRHSRRRDEYADRSSLKSTGTSRTLEIEAYNRIRSEQIDDSLRENQKQMRNVIKVLLMGSANSGKLTVLEQIQASHRDYSRKELEAYRTEILSVVVDAMRIVLEYADETGLKLKTDKNVEMVLLQSHDDSELTPELLFAIESLWTNNHIGRITSRGYSPTAADILRIPMKQGIEEHRYTIGTTTVQVYDVCNAPSHFKWLPLDLTAVIFNVNLLSYDPTYRSEKALRDVLTFFDGVVNDVLFRDKCVILLFHHTLLFRAKLTVRLLQKYFPEYNDDPSFSNVEGYISNRFCSLDQRCGLAPTYKKIYPIFDNCKPSVLGGVNAVLKSFILEKTLFEYVGLGL
ncbi:hypothetical protein MMC17_003451 [Xylographa soralifera]|nr:hypothetical protein [Xylographa soralifera]